MPSRDPQPSLTLSLLVWLLIQLAALALAASRIELSANYAAPPEGAALHVMLIAQFMGSALLFPFILDGRRAFAVGASSAAMMLALAWMMTAVPPLHAAIAWGHVALWLAALAVWRVALPTRLHLAAVAAATLLVGGGLVAWYLYREYQPAAAAPLTFEIIPPAGLLAHLDQPARHGPPLCSLSLLIVAGGCVFASKRRLKDRAAIVEGKKVQDPRAQK